MATAGAGRGRRKRAAMADINVTPMVDVMLVLLVIFMITAPVLKDGIDVDLPKAHGGTSGGTNATPFSVIIDSAGRVHCAGRTLLPGDVPVELPKLLKGHEKEMLTLKAQRTLPYDSVVKVISVVRAAGISGISIAVERD
jgi:biopolymer transport protein ExbD